MKVAMNMVLLAGLLCSGLLMAADPAVLVLDLDAVAQQLGEDQAIQQALQEKQQELQQRIAKMQEDLRAQIEAKTTAVGESPSETQKAELQAMMGEANRTLQQATNEARQEANDARVALIRDFREKVRPAVARVRAAHGAQLVLLKNDLVFDFAEAIDITAEVTAAAKAAK